VFWLCVYVKQSVCVSAVCAAGFVLRDRWQEIRSNCHSAVPAHCTQQPGNSLHTECWQSLYVWCKTSVTESVVCAWDRTFVRCLIWSYEDDLLRRDHRCILVYIFLDTVLLINILWPSLLANKDGGPVGSIFSCRAKDCRMSCTKPVTTKQQSVFWSVSQSWHMPSIFADTCPWISLAAASGDDSVNKMNVIWHCLTSQWLVNQSGVTLHSTRQLTGRQRSCHSTEVIVILPCSLWDDVCGSPAWAREHCRISPSRFLAECRMRRLNQASFVLLCFVLFVFLGCL